MEIFDESSEYQKALINSAAEAFPADIKAVNFVLNRIHRSHIGCDFNLNGDLVINQAYEMVKHIPVSELGEDKSISVFYIMTSYLHKRHFNFQSTISNNYKYEPELTHVSPRWNEDLDERVLTKPAIADEMMNTMRSYMECNSEQFIVDNFNNWKNIAAKSRIFIDNDIFIIESND